MIEINGAYANAIVYTDEIEASASRSKSAPSTTSNPATGSPAKRSNHQKKRRLYKVLKDALPEGLAYDEE